MDEVFIHILKMVDCNHPVHHQCEHAEQPTNQWAPTRELLQN